MSSAQPQFSCSACGKVYAWKPQLAGKKGTCKCGNVFQAPMQPEAPDAAVPTCPSCGAELGEGAVLCINCGYNLKTGAAVQTQVEQEASLAAAVAPGRMASAAPAPRAPGGAFIPPQRRREEARAGSHQKQMILGGVALLVIIGVIVGAKLYFKKSRDEGPMLGRDAEATEMLRTQGPKEAIEFLDGSPNTMLGNQWTKAVAKIRVNGWYEMGAKKVYAFGSRMSASVVIELPDNPEGRKKLFDWVRQWDKDHNPGRAPQTDVGQRYLIVALIGGGLG